MDFNGKTVAIIGVAKSGIAAARLLKGLGANIIMYDAKPKEAFPESLLESISDIGYEDMFGADMLTAKGLGFFYRVFQYFLSTWGERDFSQQHNSIAHTYHFFNLQAHLTEGDTQRGQNLIGYSAV